MSIVRRCRLRRRTDPMRSPGAFRVEHMKADAMSGKGLKRRDLLLGGTSLAAASRLPATGVIASAQAQPARPPAARPSSLARRPAHRSRQGRRAGRSRRVASARRDDRRTAEAARLCTLYHLYTEEEPEDFNYPRDPKFRDLFGSIGIGCSITPPLCTAPRRTSPGCWRPSRNSRQASALPPSLSTRQWRS